MPIRYAVRSCCAFLLYLVLAGELWAQGTGRIVGRVVDAEQGAPVAGAQVELVDAPIRAVAALDGRYTLDGVPAGPVSVRVRMIGYGPKTVTGIQVPQGGTVSQDLALAGEVVQLAEISVSAEAERGTVNRALEEQRNASNIVSSITSEQIQRSPDSDAGQAVQRVSGVSVQDGKYVFVRGLGERYTTTSLNGSRIQSRAGAESCSPRPLSGGPARRYHHLQDFHSRSAGGLQRRLGQSQDARISGAPGHHLLGVGRAQHRRHRKGSGAGAARG